MRLSGRTPTGVDVVLRPLGLDDAEVFQQVRRANAAWLEPWDATSPDPDAAVKSFAETMVRDHKAVNDQALALVKKLGVTPEENPTSTALSEQAKATLARLDALSGAEYDRAYVDNEVAYHRTVNGALRDTLIPSASNAELKSLLQTGLKLFGEHQAHAEHLAADLGKAQ